ncbi:hypothetical protein FOZ63_029691 [Perkinsus olseni]|uniref:Sjoegren syndrome/scleroderma autoantigen 1 n=1 Tax=Perkinsus olseni TaxID=32597 RepID=A0A7J6SNT8_PEROL|nr:hypothetical protein FOZ62_004252 [Perkinsus olseni]KAF4745667.1 hypothetical protein FOZ63_029691 [Perkinsus olseni]
MPSDTSAAIGEYLLKGWAMLGDSCPQCCIPLLRSPDRVKMVCVGCNSEWPVDGAPNLTNGVSEKKTDCSDRKSSGTTAQGEKKQRESPLRVEDGKPTKVEIERKCTGWKQTAADALERKMEYLAKRLDEAVDMDSIERIMMAMEKCSELIEKMSEH